MSAKISEQVSKIAIKAYCDPKVSNMGFENYNYVVFPGTYQVEPLAAIEQNGKTRYITGLNEFAPEVRNIADKDKREATIREIREIIVKLEQERAFNNTIAVGDKNFWEKVEMFQPDNKEVWGKIALRLGNDDQVLDPTKNLDHLIIIRAIENNGFSLVASSFEEARRTKKKWYLDRQIDSAAATVSVKKLVNKASSLLESISDENPRKLFYIAKIIGGINSQFTNRTLNDVIYDTLDKYIKGDSHDSDVKRCAQTFIETAKLSNEELKVKAIVKDASFFKYINSKPDGIIYETTQNIMLGRNHADVLEFLLNPTNEDVLDLLMDRVERLWGK